MHMAKIRGRLRARVSKTSRRGAWLCALGHCLALSVGCETTENAALEEAAPESQSSAENTGSGPPTLPYEVVDVDDGGRVRGKVQISGEVPILEDWLVEKDQGVCGETVPNRSLRLGAGGGVQNAVVSLQGITQGKELQPLSRVAEIEIVKCRLVPRHLLVPVGSTLEMVNSDPVLHDIQARVGETLLFDTALPIRQFRIHERLDDPGIVTLASGAGHTWMSGVVVVQAHPYFARTDAGGAYTIDDIPPGTYQLRVWHELLVGEESSVTVESGATATVDFALTIH